MKPVKVTVALLILFGLFDIGLAVVWALISVEILRGYVLTGTEGLIAYVLFSLGFIKLALADIIGQHLKIE